MGAIGSLVLLVETGWGNSQMNRAGTSMQATIPRGDNEVGVIHGQGAGKVGRVGATK
jgi:hypothetical protein